MKLLGLLLQSKKGDPLIIASAPSLHTRQIILYSNLIYSNILDNYRRRQKIQRCIVLQYNLQCVLTITKDYIFYVYVNKTELGLAFDAIRKVTQYFNNNSLRIFQGAKTGVMKLDIVNKRFVEFMSFFQQYLYTRQFPLQKQRQFQVLALNSITQSNKKSLDFQIFNKFSHINSENDKRIILEMQKSSNKVAALEVRKKIKVIEHMKKFSIKAKDQLDLLESNPHKQDFVSKYRKNLVRFAHCGKSKNIGFYHHEKVPSQKAVTSASNFLIEQQFLEQTIIQRQKIKTKLMEKLQLHLYQGKIKQVIQFGQVVVEGTQPQTAVINLLNPAQYWTDPKILNKRISPNSLQIKQKNPSCYEFTTVTDYKSKPILDYIIRKQTFTADKIPLLFVYTMQSSSSNIEFIFKYKINQKWKQPLADIQITVHLSPQFVVGGDFKTIPMAISLKNNKITWKTKQISHSSSSKGKILLAFTNSNIPPKKIIKQIKLSMRCQNKSMLDGLNLQCLQEDGQKNIGQKILLVSYKVQPNE